MNESSRVTLGWPALAAGALILLAAGAGIAYFAMRSGSAPAAVQTPSGSTAPAAPGATPAAQPAAPSAPDAVISLTPDAVRRAGIKLASVTAGQDAFALRLPGVIEANAYKQVVVTPLVGGRVTRVLAELGQSVRAGQTLAEIFSPELAEAATRYVSIRADLDAHERELRRTERLVEIGSASRQELERLHAEHTAKVTELESARSRLELLGLSAAAIGSLGPGKAATATTVVRAPIAGVVTERSANAGLNVDAATKLFTVVDLSTVWVVAEVYEKDFSRVHVGDTAAVTTKAYPETVLRGRVSYIDPQVTPDTRTAKVRVEVSNPRQALRLGMFADVSIETAAVAGSSVLIPRAAVQNVGSRTVVYLADSKQPGHFVEREVRLGDHSGDAIAVLSGVHPGDTIVAEGSFNVRAERDRLGPRIVQSDAAAGVQTAKVLVTEEGYQPAKLTLRAGVLARITFVRTSDKTCGTDVVFPAFDIKRPLPLNEPVVVEFTPRTTGDVGFECGMKMLRGSIVAR